MPNNGIYNAMIRPLDDASLSVVKALEEIL